MKPIIHIRSLFDTASRTIPRPMAAQLLRFHRNHSLRRIDAGWKFINGFEPTVLSRQPVTSNVNF